MAKNQKAEKATPTMQPKKVKEFLKYQFTHDEIHEKGLTLARLSSEQTAIENEKKAVTAEFNAKIESKKAEIESIGNHINNGYEHRYIECMVYYNEPNTGMKSIKRVDTGELLRKESMTADEMQYELDLQQPQQ